MGVNINQTKFEQSKANQITQDVENERGPPAVTADVLTKAPKHISMLPITNRYAPTHRSMHRFYMHEGFHDCTRRGFRGFIATDLSSEVIIFCSGLRLRHLQRD